MIYDRYCCLVVILISLIKCVFPGAVDLNSNNIDQVLAENDVVFVNFYANWCRFSQMLQPIYDEFADKLKNENLGVKVAIAKVDCDAEGFIAQKYGINKYPTLKLYRNGVMMKREYRGARSVDAFLEYIKDQTKVPIRKMDNFYQTNEIDYNKKTVIMGYFANEESDNYKTYQKLAGLLRDSCQFVAINGDASAAQRINGHDKVFSRKLKNGLAEDIDYLGELTNYDALYAWTNERCTKLVREITFENAEELTEEGLPFLILFHKPDDLHSLQVFEKEVARQLVHERNTINAVYADGYKFSHPLHHLGKSANDLPVLAIDSFRHMYLFPDFNKISEGEHLLQFVKDLNSGKLHREFHNGPDPTEAPKIDTDAPSSTTDQPVHIPKTTDENAQQEHGGNKASTPPESVFKKLQPSHNRYTMKDEF